MSFFVRVPICVCPEKSATDPACEKQEYTALPCKLVKFLALCSEDVRVCPHIAILVINDTVTTQRGE
jgi:hypothetical protein